MLSSGVGSFRQLCLPLAARQHTATMSQQGLLDAIKTMWLCFKGPSLCSMLWQVLTLSRHNDVCHLFQHTASLPPWKTHDVAGEQLLEKFCATSAGGLTVFEFAI